MWLPRGDSARGLPEEFGETILHVLAPKGFMDSRKEVFCFFGFFFLKKEGWDAVLCSMFNIAFLNSKLSGTLRNAIISVILEPGIEKLQQLQPHLID